MARQVGAHFIDLTQLYGGVPEQVYTDYCHLTPYGNMLLARYVGRRLLPWIAADVARHAAAPSQPRSTVDPTLTSPPRP